MKEIDQKITRKKEQILLASILSSVVSTAITNPIEVAKLNFQFFPLSCRFYPHENYIKLVTCECAKFSLKGSISSLKIAIPQVLFSNLIFMQIYEHLRQTFIQRSTLNSSQSTFISSILARSVVVSLLVPFESLRIRFSNQVKNRTINFHGYKITLVRDLTFSALYWTALQSYRNTVIKGEYRQKIRKHQVFTWENFSLNMLPGFLFGMLVSAVTTPMDTLKTRIQSQGIKDYKIAKGVAQIYKRQGWTGLFSGIEWRMLKSGLHSSLYLLIYESYMKEVSFKDSFNLQE